MNEKIKLVVLDLDGTLLSQNGEVSEHGYDVLESLQKMSIKICISSGRPYYSVQRIFKKKVYDYVSCMNGLDIYDVMGNHIYHHDPLQKQEIDFCLSKLKRYPMVLSFSSNNQFYHTCSPLYKPLAILYTIVYKYYHLLTNKPYYPHKLTSLNKVNLETCEKLCFSSFHFVLKDFVKHLDSSTYSCFFVNSRWLEVCPSHVSKGIALAELKKRLTIETNAVVSIGDGENDLSLFEESGISVAMENSMQKLKERAVETTLSNLEDGAIVWLEKHLLNL